MDRLFSYFSLYLLITCIGCVQNADNQQVDYNTDIFNTIEKLLTETKLEFAPDARVALFSITILDSVLQDTVTLVGETNLPKAKTTLLERLTAEGVLVKDSISLLPSTGLGDQLTGIVNNSVANLRSKPSHSSELVTQATLGTELKLFKKERGWYLVQTPDQYFSWINQGEMQLMAQDQLNDWQQAPKLFYRATYGFAYQQPEPGSKPMSDLVAGGVLQLGLDEGDFYKALYPDGRVGHVHKDEVVLFENWLDSLTASGQSLVDTAMNLRGVPYLWGGTSTKGVDCSGFTKTIFFLNGMIIPRDASQQVGIGNLVDSVRDFSQLHPGDLLFFGAAATDSTKEKIVHVGLWIGDDQFIHSSERVRVSSINPERENYDEYNLQRYLKSKRILGSDEVVSLKKEPVL
ncbi:MAG: NlpC/P60 family protein [Cyclobacteriaceae bacterium]